MTLFIVVLASCGRTGFQAHDAAPLAGGDASVGGPSDALGVDVNPGADANLEVVCGAAYQPVAGLSSRYRLGGAETSWQLAEQDCEADGGHLPVIDDAGENLWLQSQVIGWIGLTDHETEGTFLFVTGAVPVYTSWNPNEPSDTGDAEDCVAHYFGIEWNDYACSVNRPYMCECDGTPMPSPAVWCVTGIDSSCDTCGDACPDGTTCSASQTCL